MPAVKLRRVDIYAHIVSAININKVTLNNIPFGVSSFLHSCRLKPLLFSLDDAKLNQHPIRGYTIKNSQNRTDTEFSFNCSVTLDTKTSSAEIYWRTNVKDSEQKITKKMTGLGVQVSVDFSILSV